MSRRREGNTQMKIIDVKAYPTSFRVPKEQQVSLGIGTMTDFGLGPFEA